MTRSVPEWIADSDDQAIPPRVKARVFEKHGGRCALTGRKIMPGDKLEFDHEIALINGGQHRESNLRPVLGTSDAHKAKTRQDMAQKKKNERIRKKHMGIAKSKNPMPGGRGSKFKKKVSGEVVPRD